MHSPCCGEVMTLNNVVLWIKQLLNQQTEMLRNESSSFYLSKRCSVLSCISFIVLNRWKVDCLYIVKRYTTKCCFVVFVLLYCIIVVVVVELRQAPGSVMTLDARVLALLFTFHSFSCSFKQPLNCPQSPRT